MYLDAQAQHGAQLGRLRDLVPGRFRFGFRV